jgi:type VI secretion system secreted protein Hcp
MAANIFMLFDDITGDATESKHTEWVVLESASWSLERSVDMSDIGSTQRGHANSNFGKLECTTQVGIASNGLMLSVANGTVRPEITMHLCRSGDSAGEGLMVYNIWKFKHSTVDSYSVSMGADGIPEANFTLAYLALEVEYKETDQKTGKLSTKNTFKWNVQTGMSEY